MLHRGKAKERGRKVTPPSPTFMTSGQFASYLTDLRNNRIARPGGAREQPSYRHSPEKRYSTGQVSSVQSYAGRSSLDAKPGPPASTTSSSRSRYSIGPNARDYYPDGPAKPLRPSEIVPSAVYIERGQRWMEKEEAFSLRQAMQDMDIKDQSEASAKNEDRIYQAALDEAAELVWQHQRGIAASNGPYQYRPHLRKNSYAHARTASAGRYGNEISASGLARDCSRTVSGSSSGSDGPSTLHGSARATYSNGTGDHSHAGCSAALPASNPVTAKAYTGIRPGKFAVPTGGRRSSMKRNISGEVAVPFSGDQIWEEPIAGPESCPLFEAGATKAGALGDGAKNGANKVHFAQDSGCTVSTQSKPRASVNIHHNQPSQSRNPMYTTNRPAAQPAFTSKPEKQSDVEIRSDDIRMATSMRMKDRSERLPTPTAVSDSPGRPIVSFDANWTGSEEAADGGVDNKAPRGKPSKGNAPSIVISDTTPGSNQPVAQTTIPSIAITGPTQERCAIPPIVVGEPSEIREMTAGSQPSGGTGVPAMVTSNNVGCSGRRPLPSPGETPRIQQRSHRPRTRWSPPPGSKISLSPTCHECGFPIQGRFVALAGSLEKFHPQCFVCFTCGTSLEALEISPEPEPHRNERLDRIKRRKVGEVLEEFPGKTERDDGDERLRFYCHLDWHELFAPKCKHCRTPILGEHIVALGEHWHYGHFFCAECGDPFEHGMTHIEKDGYAWCIRCQTRRTERGAPKCRKCKQAVIGQYICALGGEWHDDCFRCFSCNGSFDDGQIFPKERNGSEVVLCTKCRSRELKG